MSMLPAPIIRKNSGWTFQNFLEKANKKYGTLYNYSEIESGVSIRCNNCLYKWSVSLRHRVIKCANCSKRVHWTLEKFLKCAKDIHGDKYDYSAITNTDINNAKNKIRVKCNLCSHKWTPTLNAHINIRTCKKE